MYGRKMHFVTKCLAPKALFIVTLHPEMGHEADQEKLVRRMVDERWAELKPKIDAYIDERIKAANQQK